MSTFSMSGDRFSSHTMPRTKLDDSVSLLLLPSLRSHQVHIEFVQLAFYSGAKSGPRHNSDHFIICLVVYED